jgi:DNA-binding XRE family transcriptional regulator
MTTFANQLKNEIARIARKESRADSKQVKKSSTQYRTEIASLKRRISALETSVARLLKQKPERVASNEPVEKQSLRFRAGGFATLRKKLDLTAADMGKLVGVSAQSVYHWEQEKSRPRSSQLPAIAAVRKLTKKQAHQALSD